VGNPVSLDRGGTREGGFNRLTSSTTQFT
jgi:hypothetical protein